MTGFLVINHFLRSEKLCTLHNYLADSAQELGIELKTITNQEMLFCDEKADFVLFWDKDVNLARALENSGMRVFNSSSAIELCDDKAKTYLALNGAVAQPETIIAPLSFFDCDYSTFAEKAVERLGLPVVFKECFGSFGEQVYLCNSVDEVLSHITSKPFLLQKYIEANGTDVRIEVIGGECVGAVKRVNEHDFRSNITNGGKAFAYQPTEKEKALAIKACKVLGLDFGGVDIINSELVCEVNSNAHIVNLKNATGIDSAKMIFKYIMGKI